MNRRWRFAVLIRTLSPILAYQQLAKSFRELKGFALRGIRCLRGIRRGQDKKGTAHPGIERSPETNPEAVDYDAAVRQIWSSRASWPPTIEPERWLAERARIELEEVSSSPGAKSDFDALCNYGCHPHILGFLLFFLRRSPEIEAALATFTGLGKKREANARRLDEASSLIERLFGRLPSDANEVVAGLFSKEVGIGSPAQQAIGLRQTAQFIRLGRILSRRNLTQLSLLLLSSYVEQITGGPHDAKVSGLVAAVRGNDYDEDAHKSWRSRNMRKISHSAIGDWHIAEFLVGLSTTLSDPLQGKHPGGAE